MATICAGIDVSKTSLNIHLNGRDETATNDTDGFRKVARILREGNAERVVMEATGRMHRALLQSLHDRGFCTVVVNPRQSRDFAKAGGELAKTDRVGAGQEEKRTNEIGTVIPLLDTLPDATVAGRVVTVDALLTRRALAGYLLDRGAAFLFTVKGNQKTLMGDIRLPMDEAVAERPPDFVQESKKPEHGRLERRSIWASAEINDYVRFPGVGQVFAVRREVTEVRTGERRVETACGVTNLSPEAASPKRLP